MSNIEGHKPIVNGDTRFSEAKYQLASAFKQNLQSSVALVLGQDVEVKIIGSSAPSLVNFPCPGCGRSYENDKTKPYLATRGKHPRIKCAACDYDISVVDYLMQEKALKPGDQAADYISKRMGTSLSAPALGGSREPHHAPGEAWVVHFPVAEQATPTPTGPTDGPGLMAPQHQRDMEDRIDAFYSKGKYQQKEKVAIKYVRSRGISDDVIKGAKILVDCVRGEKGGIFVRLPTYTKDGGLISYQTFDYSEVHKGNSPTYKSPKKKDANAKWPFGMQTCEGDGSILMTCGFFDYLSALEIGFKKVLSPFGVTMLAGGAQHISDLVIGQKIMILFDRKLAELKNAKKTAASLMEAGAKCVDILVWSIGPIGFDLNDFLLHCRKKDQDPKKRFSEAIKKKVIKKYPHDFSVTKAGRECGLIDEPESEPEPKDVLPAPTHSEPSGGPFQGPVGDGDDPVFVPDLDQALFGLSIGQRFDTIGVITAESIMFEVAKDFQVKPCALERGEKTICTCFHENPVMSFDQAKYASAFIAKDKCRSPNSSLIDINHRNKLKCDPACPNNRTSEGEVLRKSIEFAGWDDTATWKSIRVSSLLRQEDSARMLLRYGGELRGIKRLRGYKSESISSNSTVYILEGIGPVPDELIIEAAGGPPPEGISRVEFSDRMASILSHISKFITEDAILLSGVCMWQFSPLIIPRIEDIGVKIENHKLPAMSMLVVGDPRTGKTKTVETVTKMAGYPVSIDTAGSSTEPGLMICGASGNVGSLPMSIGRSMCLDEITEKKELNEVYRKLIDNILSISKSGMKISEHVPCRVGLLTNPDNNRNLLSSYITPMDSLRSNVKDHVIRRPDIILSTKSINNEEDREIRRSWIADGTVSDVDIEEMSRLGERSWVQQPHDIAPTEEALDLLKDERIISSMFADGSPIMINNHVYFMGSYTSECNLRMPTDICYSVFRVACSVACFCGSFDEEKLVVTKEYVVTAIYLMKTWMRSIDIERDVVDRKKEIGVDGMREFVKVFNKSVEWQKSLDPLFEQCGNFMMSFICEARSKCKGHKIDQTPNRAIKNGKYKKAVWRLINDMKDSKLISGSRHGSYVIESAFVRVFSDLETDEPGIFRHLEGMD